MKGSHPIQIHSKRGNAVSKHLLLRGVHKRIRHALRRKKPFSLVRIGDGENIVLAQKSVWSIRKVMKQKWARKARRGKKGVTLPNLKLRNEMVRSIRRATVVGILPKNDRNIRAPRYLKRKLTKKVFNYYKLKPKLTCHACVNRFLARRRSFWRMLRKYRVLIINKHPKKLKRILRRRPYRLKIRGTIAFSHYRHMRRAVRKARAMKNRFDVALISCGVNAVILAPRIAKSTGKVAIDFGKGTRRLAR